MKSNEIVQLFFNEIWYQLNFSSNNNFNLRNIKELEFVYEEVSHIQRPILLYFDVNRACKCYKIHNYRVCYIKGHGHTRF